jgi:hypothetical protein
VRLLDALVCGLGLFALLYGLPAMLFVAAARFVSFLRVEDDRSSRALDDRGLES